LNSNAITLFSATAIVLGAEVGTSIKLVLASLRGLPAKKRVAMGNLFFNISTTIIVLIFLVPINRFITVVAGIHGNLLALVFFQSLVNLSGIIVFYPFLGVFGRFLEKHFAGTNDETFFIRKTSVADTEFALEALEKETRNLIFHVLGFTADSFETEHKAPKEIRHKNFEKKQVKEKYEYIKTLHGEIHSFAVKLQNASSPQQEKIKLHQLISCIRNSMYAAKNIRDMLHDLDQLRNSSNDTKYNFYVGNREKITDFCKQASILLERPGEGTDLDNIKDIYTNIQRGYTHSLEELYKEGIAKHVTQVEISTLINFNREMYTALKSLVFVLKDYLLEPGEADQFDNLPGFIR